jgi:tryptophan synthase alpha chain
VFGSPSRRRRGRGSRPAVTRPPPGRHAGHPARLALLHAPGRRRPGHRGGLDLGRARLPGHRAAARGADAGRAADRLVRDRHGGRGRRAAGRPDRRDPRGRGIGPRRGGAARRAGPTGGGRGVATPPAREWPRPWPPRRPPESGCAVDRCRARVVVLGLSGRGDKDLAAISDSRRSVDDHRRRPSTAVTHGAAVPTPTGTAAPTPRRPWRDRAAVPFGHQRHARRAAHRRRLRRAAAEGRAALIPYVVAGYPDHETSLAAALAARRRGRGPARSGIAVFRSDGRRSHASASDSCGRCGPARRSIQFRGADRAIAGPGPNVPLVPMCYANQIIGGGDGRNVATRLAEAGASGVIVADLTPDEGRRFEAVAREVGLAVVYLIAPTTTPGAPREVARRSGGFLYCVSLVGVTGARTPCRHRSGLVAAAGPIRRCRSPSDSVSASPPTSGCSSTPAPTASSWPRPSSTHLAPTGEIRPP